MRVGFLSNYARVKPAMIGLVVIGVFTLVALLAPLISPFDPHKIAVGPPLSPPSLSHLMGTDDLGRDIFSEFLYGSRVELLVGFLSAGATVALGTAIGAAAGYYGGILDDVLMRITEIFMTLPRLFLAIVAVAIFGATVLNVIVVISAVSWPLAARLVRAEFLSLRERDFVSAAKIMGVGKRTIILSEILPNALPPIITNAMLQTALAITLEASLAFFGLSDPRQVSWGSMLRDSMPFIQTSWWVPFFPGVGIMLLILSAVFVGDGLNSALNPRTLERSTLVR